MSESSPGALRPASGTKVVTPQGTVAVRDGIKPNALSSVADVSSKPA